MITATAYPDTSGNSISSTLFASPTFNAMGAMTSAQLAIDPASQMPGISRIRSYDNRLRLTGETDTNAELATLYNYAVAYDSGSNVTGFSDSVMGSWSITSDHLHRLYEGAATAGIYSGLNYQYLDDSFGNATTRAFGGSTSQPVPVSTNPTYNMKNQMVGVSYDADGDVTDDGTNSYLYDAEGRICAIRSDLTQAATGYLYDGNGIRVAKGTLTTFSCDFTSNGFSQTNLYVQGLQGEQLQESDSSFNLLHFNVFLGSTVLATYAGSGYQQANWHYSLNDWVGTRRVQANAEGVTEGSFLTMPFGDNLTTTGTPGSTEHEFTGKERDTESGNDYFPARYYASSAGRFLSPDWSATQDPVPYASLSAPQSLNLYAYAFNNPLSFVDEFGHEGESKLSISSCFSVMFADTFTNCMDAMEDAAELQGPTTTVEVYAEADPWPSTTIGGYTLGAYNFHRSTPRPTATPQVVFRRFRMLFVQEQRWLRAQVLEHLSGRVLVVSSGAWQVLVEVL